MDSKEPSLSSDFNPLRFMALSGLSPFPGMSDITDSDVLSVICLMRNFNHPEDHILKLSAKLKHAQSHVEMHGMISLPVLIEQDREEWRALIQTFNTKMTEKEGDIIDMLKKAFVEPVADKQAMYTIIPASRVVHISISSNSGGRTEDRVIEKHDAKKRVSYEFVRYDNSGKISTSGVMKTGTVVDKSVVLEHYKAWAGDADKNCIAL